MCCQTTDATSSNSPIVYACLEWLQHPRMTVGLWGSKRGEGLVDPGLGVCPAPPNQAGGD